MSNGKNIFLDDEEVDDYAFLNHHPQGQSGYLLGNDSKANSEYELRQKLLIDERKRIEERTLQSAKSSLGMLHESEQVGLATAEELMRQGEQLHGVEKNLDIIDNTMRISQKHINSMKSVFGGIKSFFSKNSTTDAAKSEDLSAAKPEPSTLHGTVGNLRLTQKPYETPHPALRVRDINYDDEEDDGDDFVKVPRSESTGNVDRPSMPNFDDQLDHHLEDISAGLGRLKNLSIGLHNEIADHNETLDRLYNKTDNVDNKLQYQNRQINRILKK